MCTRVRWVDERSRPNHTHRVSFVLVPVVLPDTVGICSDGIGESIIWRCLMQQLQIAHKDALELVAVAAATWLAAIVNYAIVV
jgi:hypothetical protein